MICPADSERLADPAVREGVLELVGPAGVVEKVSGREWDVDIARLLDRLAAIERLEHGELAGSLLQDRGRSGTASWPARSVSRVDQSLSNACACCADGCIDIVGARVGDRSELLLVGRVQRTA